MLYVILNMRHAIFNYAHAHAHSTARNNVVYWRAGASVQLARFFGKFMSIRAGPGALHTPTAMFYVVLNIRHRRKMRMRILSPLWSEMRMRILSAHPWSGSVQTVHRPLDSVLAGYIHGFGVPHTERTAYTGRWGYPISRGLRPNSSNGSLSCF